jgi:hypothetical protein
LTVIPETTPSSGLRRTVGLGAGAWRREVPREAGDARPVTLAVLFFLWLALGEAFLPLVRVFPATGPYVDYTPLFRFSHDRTEKMTALKK